jgi:hypothetical protein
MIIVDQEAKELAVAEIKKFISNGHLKDHKFNDYPRFQGVAATLMLRKMYDGGLDVESAVSYAQFGDAHWGSRNTGFAVARLFNICVIPSDYVTPPTF